MCMEDIPIFFDLQKELTTNPEFAADLQAIMTEVITAESDRNIEKSREKMTKLLRKCDFNPSLLLPYFFPNFSDAGPMTLWTRPHAFAMMAHIPNGVLTVAASRQIGKCICGETKLKVKRGYLADEEEITAQELFDDAAKILGQQ